MAKKQKEEAPNVNATANRDIIQRLNFLYQASIYLQSVAPPPSPSVEPHRKKEELQIGEVLDKDREIRGHAMFVDEPEGSKDPMMMKCSKKSRRKVKTNNTGDLARGYVQCMRIVGQKTTVKMDPSLKRSLCSGCSTALVPGSSVSIRVKHSPSHGHLVVYTCLHCRTTKRIPAPPNITSITASSDLSTLSSVLPDASETQPHASSTTDPLSVPKETPLEMKKKRHPRPPPLFARPDAGHVVFRGNERLELDNEGGFGVCFS